MSPRSSSTQFFGDATSEAARSDGEPHDIQASEWQPQGVSYTEPSPPTCPQLAPFEIYQTFTSNDSLKLTFHGDISIDLVYPPLRDTGASIVFRLNDSICQPSTPQAPSPFNPKFEQRPDSGCREVSSIRWPGSQDGQPQVFSISFERPEDDPATPPSRVPFTVFILRAVEYAPTNITDGPSSSSSSSSITTGSSDGVPGITVTNTSPGPPLGSTISSSSPETSHPILASSHSPSKTRIIVPAVVVPVVVLLLGALAFFVWRRRTRAKIAPSAAFKMENPTFTPGETWVPIDEKRAFSPGPTKVGEGSSL